MAQSRYGDLSFFPGDHPVGRSLQAYGEWAQAEIDFLCGLLGPGGAAIDIGANIGTHTLALSQRVGPEGSIRAFEPHLATFGLLKRNLSLAKCHNVDAVQTVVTDHGGEMIIPELNHLRRVDIDTAMYLVEAFEPTVPRARVQATTLDALHLQRCDLIKIDTEFMGVNVIRGMADTIRRFRPLIYCACKTVKSGFDLYDLLPDGYEAHLVRSPVFNVRNFAGASENIFGHACESGLLFSAIGAVAFDRSLTSVEVLSITDSEDLAAHILATPRYGDETPFARNAPRLMAEMHTLQGLLRHRDEKVDVLEDRHQSIVEEREHLRIKVKTFEEADIHSADQIKTLSVDLKARDEEIARFRFRCASLSKQLRVGEDALVLAQSDTTRTEDERTRLHEELVRARIDLEQARVELARRHTELEQLHDDLRELQAKADRSEAAQRAESVERRAQMLSSRPRRLISFPFSRERRAYRQIAASGLFDETWYRNEYTDVAKSGIDPLIHFLRVGASEGRNPSSFFSTSLYCAANPDVVAAKMNPLLHYVLHGRGEGRAREPSIAHLSAGASA